MDAKARQSKSPTVIPRAPQPCQRGNLGDYRAVGDGVYELRFDFGPGYRIYFGEDGNKIILLGGGDKSTMPKRTREYRDSLLEDLRDPAEAAEYLNAALEDSNEMFLLALRDVAEARQLAKVAEEAGIARESIYRSLARRGNPTLSTLLGVLRAVGLRIAVMTEEHEGGSGPRCT